MQGHKMKGEGGQAQGEVKAMVLDATSDECGKSLAKELLLLQIVELGVQEKSRHFERCTEEKNYVKKIKKSAENLTFACPSTICQWVLLAEDPEAGDPCSEVVWLCCPASLPFCPVLLLGDTVHSGCWLRDGSNVLFLYTLMNKN